jgi:VanZ family protein
MPVNIALQIKTSVVKKIISLLWLWTPVFIWMGMIFYSSSLIMEESKIDVPNIDKLFHFIEYFILGYLWTRALTYTSSNPNYLYIFIAAVIISTLYGVSDEVHQLFVPTRSCDAIDLLSDLAGSAAGAGLSVYKERIKRAIDKTV